MIGTQVGRYRIESEIGRGGMGVVYRGIQVTLDRPVAIKMLPAHLADPDNRDRFRREALTLARLAHPNIVHIYDVEDLDGSSFIVMEHVGGGSLGDLIRTGPLAPGRAVEIMGPILSALQAAHLAGVVHRDIKPDNILFGEGGRPKLTDFGIAHMRDGGARTRTGVMLGTPYYMSPEQARGQKVSERTDLYAVGVVLYEMLSGRVPFTGEDPMAVALQHVQAPARPLNELRPELPPALCSLVHRALEKDPGARLASAAAMQDAIESGSWAPLRTSDPGSSERGVVVVPLPAPAGAPTAPTTSADGPSLAAPPPNDPGSSGFGHLGDGPERLVRAAGAGLDRARNVARNIARNGLPALRRAGRSATGALGRPAWRGLPIAFWTGIAAVATGVVGIGVSAAIGRTDAPPTDQTRAVGPPVTGGLDASDPLAPPGVASGAGGGPAAVPRSAARRAGPSTRPLTEGDVDDLVAIAGRDRETPTDDPPSESVAERALTVLDPTTPVPNPEERVEQDSPVAAEAKTTEQAARREIQAIVERQRRAVETTDRALFLRDIHPDSRAEAAEIFDGGYAEARDLRSSITNVQVDFLAPDHAYVSFDVDLTYVVRTDGRTVRDSVREEWDMIHEEGSWWILTWN